MLTRVLALVISSVLCVSMLGGCGSDSDSGGQAEEVKTAAQHKTDAEKDITAENMDDELEKIEKEMAAEGE